jgi:DNA-binding NtrC family response regulator
MQQRWPGNVRELENAIERAIVNSRDALLTPEDFAFLVEEANHEPWQAPVGMTLQDMERRLIVATMQHLRGNVKAAAAALGIDRSTLYDKIHKYGIQRATDEPHTDAPSSEGA